MEIQHGCNGNQFGHPWKVQNFRSGLGMYVCGFWVRNMEGAGRENFEMDVWKNT